MELVMSNIALTLSRPWSGLRRYGGRIRVLFSTLGLALQVRRERRALLALDDRVLKDLGFHRADLHAEVQRSFWDVPVDRLRF